MWTLFETTYTKQSTYMYMCNKKAHRDLLSVALYLSQVGGRFTLYAAVGSLRQYEYHIRISEDIEFSDLGPK